MIEQFSSVNGRATEASASVTLARHSTETSNKQYGQEVATIDNPLGPIKSIWQLASD